MRPENNHVIFEGALEARVAAQLLSDAGAAALLIHITPEINPPSIGRLEFLRMMNAERKGRGDRTEYGCPAGPSIAIIEVLKRATADEPSKLTDQPALSRKTYMGRRLTGFFDKLDLLRAGSPQTDSAANDDETAAAEQARFLAQRAAFTDQYCTKQGWDPQNLSLEQLRELRNQPGWQYPLGPPKGPTE